MRFGSATISYEPRAVDFDDIELKLPTDHARKLFFRGMDESAKECTICLEPIVVNDLFLTKCAHGFHRDCIAQIKKSACPNCRMQFKWKGGTTTMRADSDTMQTSINDISGLFEILPHNQDDIGYATQDPDQIRRQRETELANTRMSPEPPPTTTSTRLNEHLIHVTSTNTESGSGSGSESESEIESESESEMEQLNRLALHFFGERLDT